MNMNRRQWLLAAGASLASWSVLPGAQATTQGSRKDASSPNLPLLFGVDYYPDQTREGLWQHDASEMAAMGITNVRIAEFAWALLEPEEGKFDFSWLQGAIDLLHGHGIAVILGTP